MCVKVDAFLGELGFKRVVTVLKILNCAVAAESDTVSKAEISCLLESFSVSLLIG